MFDVRRSAFDVQFLSRLPPPRSKFGVRRSTFDVRFLSHLPPPRSMFEVGNRARHSFSDGWLNALPAEALAKAGWTFNLHLCRQAVIRSSAPCPP